MKRIDILDYGRFFAAIMVVLFHYTFNGIANGKIKSIAHIPCLTEITKYGYLGVEFFFLISGYVIFFSATNKTASEFISSRLQRLYPAYWFAVLFSATFTFFFNETLPTLSISQVLMNLSLFQSYFNVGHVDGVYWTLVLEIQFYIGIGLLLFMNCKGRRLKHFFILWPFIMLCANLINFGKYPLLGGYFSYFAAGAIFAMLHQGYNKKVTFLALCITFYLCITTSISKALMKGELVNDVFSPVVISIIIISFFLFFCAIGFDKIKSLKLPFARYAGALTYPVYLIHAHVGYILINHYATPNNKFLVYCLVILFVLVIALFIHNIIETKMYLFWQKYFKFFIRQPILILQNLKEMALAK